MKKGILAIAATVFIAAGLFADGDPSYRVLKIDAKAQTVTIVELSYDDKVAGKPFVVKVDAKTEIQKQGEPRKFSDLKKNMKVSVDYDQRTGIASFISIY